MVPLRSLAEVRIVVGPARAHPLQQPARGDGAGLAGAGRLLRPGARRDGIRRAAPYRRASAENGPTPLSRRKRAEGKTAIILAFAVLFAFCSWSRSTKAGRSPCRC